MKSNDIMALEIKEKKIEKLISIAEDMYSIKIVEIEPLTSAKIVLECGKSKFIWLNSLEYLVENESAMKSLLDHTKKANPKTGLIH